MLCSQAEDGGLVFSCELVKIIIGICVVICVNKTLPVVPIAHVFKVKRTGSLCPGIPRHSALCGSLPLVSTPDTLATLY